MKNPLKNRIHEINAIIFRCYYWQKCPYYDREKCWDAWVMGHCGKYKKYLKEECEKEKKT